MEPKKERLYTASKNKTMSSVLQNLKKVRKTTMSFRYDLNQSPYDYIVEATNRFKGLNLTDRVPEVLNIVHGSS